VTGGAEAARRLALALAALGAVGLAGCSGTEPSPDEAEFLVEVASETFVMRARDAETISLAREALAGRNQRFPIGPLRTGHGGFNAPWSWHLDPAEVRMTEAAIEVCDGRPSYVETHLADYPTYCPWGAKIVSERR
jgi:hypothetical protein